MFPAISDASCPVDIFWCHRLAHRSHHRCSRLVVHGDDFTWEQEAVEWTPAMKNVLHDIPTDLPDEVVEVLVKTSGHRIERIVSHGQASPDGFWYDQEQSEWVVLLTGAARLRIEDETVEMQPGDFIDIPPHKRHRVEWTTPDEPTIWLAVHYNG